MTNEYSVSEDTTQYVIPVTPTYICPRGHEGRYEMRLTVDGMVDPRVACSICWFEWLAEKFPMQEVVRA